MATKTELTFTAFGNHGLSAASDGEFAYIRTPLARASAKPSKSGKMVLTGDSGSFQTVPGTEGLRANISVGYSAK